MTGGAVILTPTVGATTRRPRNVSTRTTRMTPTYGTGTFTNRPADSPMRSLLGLAVVKAVEEVDVALVAVEAMDKAVEDSNAMAAFRAVTESKAVDAATIMIKQVTVAKVITTKTKAHIIEPPSQGSYY